MPFVEVSICSPGIRYYSFYFKVAVNIESDYSAIQYRAAIRHPPIIYQPGHQSIPLIYVQSSLSNVAVFSILYISSSGQFEKGIDLSVQFC